MTMVIMIITEMIGMITIYKTYYLISYEKTTNNNLVISLVFDAIICLSSKGYESTESFWL